MEDEGDGGEGETGVWRSRSLEEGRKEGEQLNEKKSLDFFSSSCFPFCRFLKAKNYATGSLSFLLSDVRVSTQISDYRGVPRGLGSRHSFTRLGNSVCLH